MGLAHGVHAAMRMDKARTAPEHGCEISGTFDMQLIGMLDSPYVRRVAICLKLLGLDFEHRSISVFSGFEEFRNPKCDGNRHALESWIRH